MSDACSSFIFRRDAAH
jgi:hypothetical protein